LGHSRTFLAGDFNMDPYDDGMLGAGALHGMMTRRTALLGSRIVDGGRYHMFYNPMWGFMGDRTLDRRVRIAIGRVSTYVENGTCLIKCSFARI